MSGSAAYALSPDLGLLAEDSDRRFRRLLAVFAIPALIGGIIIPFVQISGLLKGGGMLTPTRYAKLIQQAPEQPTEQQKTVPTAKPRPQLTQEQKVEKARKKAQKAIASLQDSLAELRDTNLPKVNGPLKANVISSSTGTAPSFAQDASKTSGGIGEIGVVERQSKTGISERKTAQVRSKIGAGKDASRAGMSGNVTGRSLEELQLVFDRNKGAFYVMYQRELREHPNARGKIVVRMTIAPSGHVTSCTIVSSELHSPEFEKKVVARVLLMDFGPKNVGDFTVDYPIVFFPQN